MGRGANAKVLIKLLRDRPHATGAEIGVFAGDTSRRLLAELPGLKMLVCVDPWEYNEEFYNDMPYKRGRILSANWENVREEFRACVLAPYAGRVWAIKNTSLGAARIVEDDVLDFCFIDGNHTYKHVRADTYAWWPKVRVGGLLCGDDYRDRPGYGVIKAVTEIFGARASNHGRIWYVEKFEGDLK